MKQQTSNFGHKHSLKSKSKVAFTLAEVLITLVIVGVLASMTIPNLINAINQDQYNVALKKMYSELSQVVMQLQQPTSSFQIVSNTAGTSTQRSYDLANEFGTVLNFTKIDTAYNIWGQIGYANGSSTYRNYKGTAPAYMHLLNYEYTGVLPDGAFVGFTSRLSYHEIYVDTNGSKGPNMLGVDVNLFALQYVNNEWKLSPYGAKGANWQSTIEQCAANSTTYDTSWGCTARRLINPASMP